jgi:hypothetical protein
MFSYLVIIFLINFNIFASILLETGKKSQYCFYKVVNPGDSLHLSFVITGENEEKVNAVLVDSTNRVVYETHNSDSGDFKIDVNEPNDYKLCFIPLMTNLYYISFEFFSNFEKGHTLDMAKDENFHEMKKDVADISLMFEEMEKNIRFIMDRRNRHTLIIHDIGQSIRHISYFKILVVILVSLLQVFLIQRLFAGQKSSSMNYSSRGLFEMGGVSL